MKRKFFAGALSALLGASLVLSGLPVSAVAEVLAAEQAQAAAATEPMAAEQAQAAEQTQAATATEPMAAEQAAVETEPADEPLAAEADAVATQDAETDGSAPATPVTAPLSSVIGTDEDGNYLFYVTLIDAENRVAATNDPERQVDSHYLPVGEGGQGGTLERGEGLRVYLRAASIIGCDQEGEGTGIQEGTTYVMGLPAELVPAAIDAEGATLVDPERPVRFFNNGDVTADGGIYTKLDAAGSPVEDANGDHSYELRVSFANVADRIDVSGTFQYGATVSERLLPGQNVTTSFVPGGMLSFNMTPEPPSTDGSVYGGNVMGKQSGATAYYYELVVGKGLGQNAQGPNYFEYRELTLETQAGAGFWINPADLSILNNYGEATNPGLRLSVSYWADGASATETLTATSANILTNTANETVLRLTTSRGTQVDVSFRCADAVDDSHAAVSYITNKAYVTVSDANGGLATDVSSIALDVPTMIYDDYDKTGNVSYYATLTMGGAADPATRPDIQMSGSVSASLGNFGDPRLSYDSDTSYRGSASQSYGFLKDQIKTQLETNSTSYYGNYYWAEFDPAVENTANVNYYVSNTSFLSGGKLIGDAGYSGVSAAFSTSDAGTFVAGYSLYDSQWSYVGTVSTDRVKGDATLVSNGTCFTEKSASDAKLQYQLKRVFANAPSGTELVVYRSSQPTSLGRYGYIVVDPGTNEVASRSSSNGWYEYMEVKDDSAKPASWRLHFFNMPATLFVGTQFRQLGSYYAADTETGGSTTDRLSVGNGAYDAQAKASNTGRFSVSRHQTGALNGRWVASDEVFWELTIEATAWPRLSSGILNINSGRLLAYRPWDGSTYTVQGSALSADGVYIKDTSQASSGGGASWSRLSTSFRGNPSLDGSGVGKLDASSTLSSSWSDNTASIELSAYDLMTWRGTNHYASGQNYGSGKYITIGFFTHLGSSGGVNEDGVFDVSAEFIAETGDVSRLSLWQPYVGHAPSTVWPTSPAGRLVQHPIKISASTTAALPQMNKSGSIVSSDDAKTHARWALSPYFSSSYVRQGDGPLFGGFATGGFSGELTFVDGMGRSSVSDAEGNKIEGVDVARHTHVDGVFTSSFSVSEARSGGSCGPIPTLASGGDSRWTRYVDGSWQTAAGSNAWDPCAPGAYHASLSTSSANALNDPLDIYVFYAGDMGTSLRSAYATQLSALGFDPSDGRFENSFVVVVRGLYNVSSMAPIAYTTVTDDAAVAEDVAAKTGATGAAALSSLCGMSLTNAASISTWRWTGHAPQTTTIEKSVTAGLSIEKSTRGVSQAMGSTALSASYTIDTTVGLTPASYVAIEDFISGYADRGQAADGAQGEAFTAADNPAAVGALADALALDNLRIVRVASDGTRETVYQNGAFAPAWQGSTLLARGELKNTQDARPGALFSANLVRADGGQIPAETTFACSYDLNLNMDGEGGFRGSEYYLGGSLAIANAAVAERPYQVVGGAEGNDAATSEQGGEGVVLATQQLGDETLQVLQGAPSLTGGEVDPDKMVLRVWPNAEVEADFLTDQSLVKTSVRSLDAAGHSSWLFYDWTGTLGKANPNVTLDDRVTLGLGDPFEGREDLTDAQKAEMGARLAQIAARHLTTSNVRVYLTGTRPSTSGNATNLSGDDLVWSVDGALGERATTTVGNSTYTLTRVDERVSTNPETGEAFLEAPGFTIAGTSLPFGKYLAVTYDMDFDREAFVAEAAEAGLLDAAGYVMGTDETPELELENSVAGDRGSKASSSAGTIEVRSATFSKSVTGASKKDGRASWLLDANLGDAFAGEATLSDVASIELGSDAAIAAAAAATSIENVTVAQNGTVVYANGAVTEAGAAAGWTAENVAVAADGSHLEVTLKNTEAAGPIGRGDAIQVRYDTVLDKDAFVRELAQRGGSLADASYTIENAGELHMGGVTLRDNDSAELEPTVPVEAAKESRGNPEDGTQTGAYQFAAHAGAGEASRTNFTMTDRPTLGTAASAQAVAAALSVSELAVTVTDAQGNHQTYSAEDVLAGRLAGAILTTADGDAFALGQVGQGSWRLAFETLERGITVDVAYTLSVDRAAYLAAGGEANFFVTILNGLDVAANDGSSASDHSYGYVRVRPDVTKRGDVLSEKAASGNPLVRWTFDVDLLSVFDSLELGQLQTAAIRDELNQMLRADVSRVEVYDLSVSVGASEPVRGAKLDAAEYDVSVDEATNALVVSLKNPAAHPRVRVVAVTECRGSTNDLSNAVDLVVDGVKKGGAKTEVKKDLVAVTQYGTVTSNVAPSWTPAATKTVDGAEPGEALAGRFEFEAVEVGEDGQPIEGGYRSRSSNDAAGNVAFDTITYRRSPVEGQRFYRISEVANDDDATYDYDATSYLVMVTVSRTDAGYTVEQQVMEPSDAEAVTFANATHVYGLAVSKTDAAGTPLAGATFVLEAAEGSRFADGSSSVELAGEGLTSFEATGLVAGCEYVLSETVAPAGYAKVAPLRLRVSEAGELEVVGGVPAGWTVDAAAFAVMAVDARLPEEPTTPGTPGEPGNPGEPGKPGEPSGPGDSGKPADGRDVPQTGDPLASAAPLVLAVVAVVAVVLALVLRRKGR